MTNATNFDPGRIVRLDRDAPAVVVLDGWRLPDETVELDSLSA